MRRVTKEMEKELSRSVRCMADLEVGSEEYLNASKANTQQAEAINKHRLVISPDMKLYAGLTTGIFIAGLIFSERHIMDTRLVQFSTGLLQKVISSLKK